MDLNTSSLVEIFKGYFKSTTATWESAILENTNGQVSDVAFNPVPIPGAAILLGSGLAAFVAVQAAEEVGLRDRAGDVPLRMSRRGGSGAIF